jgi:hypothetical protein
LQNGPIPEGKYIDHICHNTLCEALITSDLYRKQNAENQCVVDSAQHLDIAAYRGINKKTNGLHCNHEGKRYHAGFHETTGWQLKLHIVQQGVYP